jgi:hypothetical protein
MSMFRLRGKEEVEMRLRACTGECGDGAAPSFSLTSKIGGIPSIMLSGLNDSENMCDLECGRRETRRLTNDGNICDF